jgi:hypothetical protein
MPGFRDCDWGRTGDKAMIKHARSIAGALACLLLATGAAFALPLAKPEANSNVTLAGHHGGHGGLGGHGGFSFHHGGGPGFAFKGAGPRIYHGGHGYPGYAYRHHGHHGHGFYPYGYGFLPYYYYDYGYYDDCAWLRRRAEVTGSPYWWRRYEACVYND